MKLLKKLSDVVFYVLAAFGLIIIYVSVYLMQTGQLCISKETDGEIAQQCYGQTFKGMDDE